jgi:hypothetical protein
MVATEDLLPQAVLRQIGDKLYEKRKMAALEVEQIVKRLAAAGDTAKISSIIDKLIAEFAFSPQANHRKVSSWSTPKDRFTTVVGIRRSNGSSTEELLLG